MKTTAMVSLICFVLLSMQLLVSAEQIRHKKHTSEMKFIPRADDPGTGNKSCIGRHKDHHGHHHTPNNTVKESSISNPAVMNVAAVVTVMVTVKPTVEYKYQTVPETTITVTPTTTVIVQQAVPTSAVTTQVVSVAVAVTTPAVVTVQAEAAPATTAVSSVEASKPSIDKTSSYADQMVDITSLYRSYHNANPVVWNTTLVDYLKPFAESCVFKHSGGPYGENIAMGTFTTGPDAVGMWYNEQGAYDANTGFTMATGHFTALVWKSTTAIGCVTQNCGNSFYTMCSYWPAGNYLGQFQDQVELLKPGAPTGTVWPVSSPSKRADMGSESGSQLSWQVSMITVLVAVGVVTIFVS